MQIVFVSIIKVYNKSHIVDNLNTFSTGFCVLGNYRADTKICANTDFKFIGHRLRNYEEK